jgi:hypothetical protein
MRVIKAHHNDPALHIIHFEVSLSEEGVGLMFLGGFVMLLDLFLDVFLQD